MTAHNLGPVDDVVDGEMRRFASIGPNGIALCNVDGVLYAVDDNCTHADEPLSNGRLRGWSLSCVLHGATFDIRSGTRSGLPLCADVVCHRVERTDQNEVIVTLFETGPGQS